MTPLKFKLPTVGPDIEQKVTIALPTVCAQSVFCAYGQGNDMPALMLTVSIMRRPYDPKDIPTVDIMMSEVPLWRAVRRLEQSPQEHIAYDTNCGQPTNRDQTAIILPGEVSPC